MKAMRGRIALPPHCVRNPWRRMFCFAKLSECARASSRRFWFFNIPILLYHAVFRSIEQEEEEEQE
jgi:hypothetical protein